MAKIGLRKRHGSSPEIGDAPGDDSAGTEGNPPASSSDHGIGARDGDGGGYSAEDEASEAAGENEVLEAEDSVELGAPESAPSRRQGGRPKGSKSKKKSAKRQPRTVADHIFGDEPPAQKLDRKMAGLILMIVEGMTVPQLGEHARFESDERRLIEPALGNILDRMTPSTAKMFSSFADPIMLGTGLLIWATRVFSTPPAQRPRPTLIRQETRPSPAPPAAPVGTDSGDGQPADELRNDWSASV